MELPQIIHLQTFEHPKRSARFRWFRVRNHEVATVIPSPSEHGVLVCSYFVEIKKMNIDGLHHGMKLYDDYSVDLYKLYRICDDCRYNNYLVVSIPKSSIQVQIKKASTGRLSKISLARRARRFPRWVMASIPVPRNSQCENMAIEVMNKERA